MRKHAFFTLAPAAMAVLAAATTVGCVLTFGPISYPGYDTLPPPPNDGSVLVKNFCNRPRRVMIGNINVWLAPFAAQVFPWGPGMSASSLHANGAMLASVPVPFEWRRVFVPASCWGIRTAPTLMAAPPPQYAAPPPPPPPPPATATVTITPYATQPPPPPPVVVEAPPPPPPPPPPVSVVAGPGQFMVRNTCGGPVRVFIGGDPSLGRGTFLDIGPGQSVVAPWSPGVNAWTVDGRGRGRASTTVPPGTGVVSVSGNCVGIRLGM